MPNTFKNAMEQLSKAADILNLNHDILEVLRQPKRIIQAAIPVRLDNGKIKVFAGYRVQYNDARGPFKGGIRFHPKVNLEEIKALAFWMAIKCAVVGIPFGGGKGGVIVDPKTLSLGELERLSRGYIQAFKYFIGPHKDIPAPDVYTTPQIMAWMADEFSRSVGENTPGVITGKPVEVGGSKGRDTATAQGGFYILEELLKKLKLHPSKTTMIIQGFGNAGSNFAHLAWHAGFKLIGFSDSKTAVIDQQKKGFDYHIVEKLKKSKGLVDICGCKNIKCNCRDHQHISNKQFLKIDCDVLVLAALENQLTQNNARSIKAKIILELANGPTTPQADRILYKKEKIILPDVLANAGGVSVSYFEWVQNLQNYYWTESEVAEKLKPLMVKSFEKIWDYSQKNKVDLRTGAFVIAVEEIAKAISLKNI